MTDIALSSDEFELLRSYIYNICGIVVTEDKRYLILQRLEDLVVSCGCSDFSQFYNKLTASPNVDLQEKVIAAMTTNETSFFRDTHPFEAIRNYILPIIVERFKKNSKKFVAQCQIKPKIRIWSAGSSTGQEAYSLAILVQEFLAAHRFFGVTAEDFYVLATDISSRVLSAAIMGRYNEVEVSRGLTPQLRDKYFVRENKHWVLHDDIKKMVEFKKVNLTDTFVFLPCFDLVLCRNVLIYFDDPTKKKIISQFVRKLNHEGFIIVGSAESLYGVSDKFDIVHVHGSTVYKLKE